jgi:thioredoxin 1
MKRLTTPFLLSLPWFLFVSGCDSCCTQSTESPAKSGAQSAPAAPTIELASFHGDNFTRDVLESDKLVLVDFFSPSCGVCRSMEPVVQAVAAQFDGQVTVGKLSVDDSKAIAGQYDVEMIPQFLLFKEGQLVTRLGGPVSQKEMVAKIQQALDAGGATP